MADDFPFVRSPAATRRQKHVIRDDRVQLPRQQIAIRLLAGGPERFASFISSSVTGLSEYLAFVAIFPLNYERLLTTAATTTDTKEMLAIGDSINPEPVLTRLAAAYFPGAPVDLDALLASLGMRKAADKTVTFDDTAPLANVRHWLLDGGPGAQVDHIPIPVPVPVD